MIRTSLLSRNTDGRAQGLSLDALGIELPSVHSQIARPRPRCAFRRQALILCHCGATSVNFRQLRRFSSLEVAPRRHTALLRTLGGVLALAGLAFGVTVFRSIGSPYSNPTEDVVVPIQLRCQYLPPGSRSNAGGVFSRRSAQSSLPGAGGEIHEEAVALMGGRAVFPPVLGFHHVPSYRPG